MKRHKNVYIGPDSTAGILIHGKENEDWEILLNTYATAFDSLNNIMLTRVPGRFDPTTEREIRGRFWVLKRLAKKYAPETLPAIEQLEKLSLLHLQGKISDADFLRRIRSIVRKYGLSEELIDYVESRIQAAESMYSNSPDIVQVFFGIPRHPAQPKQPKRQPKRPPSPLELVRMMFGLPR